VDLWLIDPRGGSQRNAETHRTPADLYRDAGIPVRYAQVTEDYGLLASMEYLNASLDLSSRHPKCFILSDLSEFVDEIERYTWDYYAKGEQSGKSKDKPKKGFDDILNCWQYICAQLRGRKAPNSFSNKPNYTKEQLEQQAKLHSYT
jgi:hypothetical protein